MSDKKIAKQPAASGDVVEVAPPFDQTGNTALVGASLMFEILCLVAESLARDKND